MEYNHELDDAIIELHKIARLIEQNIGKGALSDDIRKIADRVNDIVVAKIR